jgi:ABC-2 type transport system permease protein
MTDRPTPTTAQTPKAKQEDYAKVIRGERKRKAREDRISPLTELVKSRFREFFREPGVVFWVFVFPLLMALGLGAAFRSKEVPVPAVAVVVIGSSPNAVSLSQRLLASDRLDAQNRSAAEAERQLARGKVDLVVTLGRDAEYRFDPKKDSGPVARLITDNVLQEAAGRKDAQATRDVKVTEPGSRYIDFLIPGLIGMNLMGSSMWGIGFNLVVARKRRLLRRYAVTPMRRPHFLLSYFFSRSLFLVIELSVLITFGALMFGTKVQGSYLDLLLVATLGASAYAALGVLVGARLENTETANGWMNFVQLPMYVLSGAFFSYERFPEWMHLPIELLPLTSMVNALRAIYNEGESLMNLGFEVGVLAVWTLVCFALAGRWFRWQ